MNCPGAEELRFSRNVRRDFEKGVYSEITLKNLRSCIGLFRRFDPVTLCAWALSLSLSLSLYPKP